MDVLRSFVAMLLWMTLVGGIKNNLCQSVELLERSEKSVVRLSLRLKDSRVSHSIHIGDDGSRIIRYLVTPADEAVAIVGHSD